MPQTRPLRALVHSAAWSFLDANKYYLALHPLQACALEDREDAQYRWDSSSPD